MGVPSWELVSKNIAGTLRIKSNSSYSELITLLFHNSHSTAFAVHSLTPVLDGVQSSSNLVNTLAKGTEHI